LLLPVLVLVGFQPTLNGSVCVRCEVAIRGQVRLAAVSKSGIDLAEEN
jgi:hypothetical protein